MVTKLGHVGIVKPPTAVVGSPLVSGRRREVSPTLA